MVADVFWLYWWLGWVGLVIIWFVLSYLPALPSISGKRLAVRLIGLVRLYAVLFGVLFLLHLSLTQLPLHPDVYRLARGVVLFLSVFVGFWAVGHALQVVLEHVGDTFLGGIPLTGLVWATIRWSILAIGLIVALQAVGVPVAPILTTLGVGGVAVALATQDILSNMFAGITMLVAHQIKPGDYVILDDGVEGFVKDITWRNTVLYSPLKGAQIIVPNNKMASSTVVVVSSGSGTFGFTLSVGVSYGSDLEKAKEIVSKVAEDIAKEFGDVNEMYKPVVSYQGFGSSSIDIKVLFRLRNPAPLSRWQIADAFVRRVKERFDEEGVEIPFSQHDIHIRDLPPIEFRRD